MSYYFLENLVIRKYSKDLSNQFRKKNSEFSIKIINFFKANQIVYDEKGLHEKAIKKTKKITDLDQKSYGFQHIQKLIILHKDQNLCKVAKPAKTTPFKNQRFI